MDIIIRFWWLIGIIAGLENLIPPQLCEMLLQWWSLLQDYLNPYQQLQVPEFNSDVGVEFNDLYASVELYVSSLDSIWRAGRVTMSRSSCSRRVEFSLPPSQSVDDSFRGATFWWTHNVQPPPNETRSFTLKMAKADRRLLPEYIDHIASCAEDLHRRDRDRLLYLNNGYGLRYCAWSRGLAFKNPSTFDTLALDPALKAQILTDLDRFSQAREFYERVGRPWNRGYLLYGPPGTGKSSLIAAIANYMKYDVYDLDLTKVSDDSELRALLLQTSNKSLIVVEDIDRAVASMDGNNSNGNGGSRVTLSGLLNFTDGLWSCCGEERIVIYTTNRKEMLDAALLRSDRMDMHILLPHCSFVAFKTLAFNYLLLTDHHLFPAVERRMTDSGVEMTPADITEILIHRVDDPVEALNAVISALDASLRNPHFPSPCVSDAIGQSNPEDCAPNLVEGASRLRRRRTAEARTQTP